MKLTMEEVSLSCQSTAVTAASLPKPTGFPIDHSMLSYE